RASQKLRSPRPLGMQRPVLSKPWPSRRKLETLMTFEERQRNRISFRTAARIIGMQMVAAVVTRQQLCGVARVPQNGIEIDHPIEFTALENPLVDLPTHAFLFRSVEGDGRARRS